MCCDKEKLVRFSRAIAIPLSSSDTVKWPVRAGKAIKPIKKEFSLEYANQIEKGIENYGEQLWKKAFDNPSQIWRISHHLINGWREAEMPREDIANNILILINGIEELSNGNTFTTIGGHELYNDFSPKLDGYINDKNILKLGAILWSYCESLYFVAREVGCEYHGPYPINKDKIVLERNFKNLFPSDLWPEITLMKNITDITIRTIHDSHFSVSFDVYNNLFIDRGQFNASFCSGQVMINGRIASSNQIMEMIIEVANELEKMCTSIEEAEECILLWQYARIFYYRKKGLAQLLDIPWEPEQELKLRFKNTSKGKKRKETKRATIESLAQEFDYSEDLRK